MFYSADIRHEVFKSSKNRTNVKLFGPNFRAVSLPRLIIVLTSDKFCTRSIACFLVFRQQKTLSAVASGT